MKKILFIIHATWDRTHWEQCYWLILAHLNFDHEVRLLFMPQAASALAQSDWSKQWQALPMYGVESCHSVGEVTAPVLPTSTISEDELDQCKQWAELII